MSSVRRPAQAARPSDSGELAAGAKASLLAGADDEARDRFGELVQACQRRASRVAFYYLRDRADADEAVQDAFVKAFLHLRGFDESLSFDVWFSRILVNGCLDRLKARSRRARWMAPAPAPREDGMPLPEPAAQGPSAEDAVLRAEAARRLRAEIDKLPDRQRSVVLLTQFDGRPSAEVGALTGLSESTVRVHLFRAMKRLRRVLGPASTAATR
jgi:RNA polymerase sigma-70 factor (ECF subfamily)